MKKLALCLVGVFFVAGGTRAQDPLKVDPQHYKLEFENSQVRVLRIHYGPREKSVMHSHPNAVAVFFTANHSKFTFPGGESVEREWKAGDARWTPAETHLPENLTDQPVELVLVELKAKPAAAKAKAKRPTP